ncbi:hypothetical protein LIER_12248 [Lithospermum erythrorhizon]|uniref:Uncharacterized protein n=1 Tax=Lithospermum erythrorhizon TaxID=34254 RepID=A0AAV3PRN9_LITER
MKGTVLSSQGQSIKFSDYFQGLMVNPQFKFISTKARILSPLFPAKMDDDYSLLLKHDLLKTIKAGCIFGWTTPGGFIGMLNMEAAKMKRSTSYVLNGANRVFDLAFELQLKFIVRQVRLGCPTLFLATMSHKIEVLEQEILFDCLWEKRDSMHRERIQIIFTGLGQIWKR